MKSLIKLHAAELAVYGSASHFADPYNENTVILAQTCLRLFIRMYS